MRDVNDDSSSRTLENGYPGHEKDSLKQKMLEHEAVFKNQVLWISFIVILLIRRSFAG